MPTLYDSISFGRRNARNRLVLAPMLTTKKEIDGFASPWHEEYYRKRAADGVGTVIVECTAVDRDGRNSPGELGLYKDEHIPAMARIARAIQEGGALALPQIHHSGRQTPADVSASPVGAREETLPDGRKVRALSDQEVADCAGAFADAAVRAAQAGFDGVELHGCHGYIIDQFISPVTNQRADRWGGETLEARLAFSKAIIDAIRERTPEDFILGYRMGFNDPDQAAGPEIGAALSGLRIDYLHVSGGIGPGPMPQGDEKAHGFWLAARAVKERSAVPVIAVNTIHTLALAEGVVANGLADAAAVARPYLLNGDWLTAQREGRELIRCLQCKGGCQYLHKGCPYLPVPDVTIG